MKTLKEILMGRAKMTENEALDLISGAREDLTYRIETSNGYPFNICADWFGLEPDYLEELMDYEYY